MDTFYLAHGPPTLSIDDSLPIRHFLKSFQDDIFTEKPKSILIISGHWETAEPTVNNVKVNDTIYDYYGFPKSMYQIKYPAPGAPELANRVKELLKKNGFERVNSDETRGLDHGAWVPLMLMYPEADIPVCQLSLQMEGNGTYHYNMGKALAPLREEGVLIIGSGSTTHNLTLLNPNGPPHVPGAREFDSWLTDCLINGRHEDIKEYDKVTPYAKMAHPSPDHFLPLHVALGAAGETAKAELIHRSWSLISNSYASYRFSTSTST